MADDKPEKLFALAVAVIPIRDGVILKRGCTELRIAGAHVEEVVTKTISVAGKKSGVTRQQISAMFDRSERSAVEALIEQLTLRRILVTETSLANLPEHPESPIDVFYWHFGTTQTEIGDHIGQKRIVVLGANELSRQLVDSLSLVGFKDILVADYPELRNTSLSDEEEDNPRSSKLKTVTTLTPEDLTECLPDFFDCLVATSNFGMSPVFNDVNKYCVRHNRHFFPVTLQNMVGYIGPLVVPGETACYECLHRRMRSHLEEPDMHQAIEGHSFARQKVASFHPLMISVLADIAAFDLFKFYCGAFDYEMGTLLEIRLLASRMGARRVLKLPRCPTCSPMMTRPSTTLKKSMFTVAEPNA